MSDLDAAYADVARIRRLIHDSRFDALVVAWPENVNYMSGFYHPDMRLTWERLHIVVWPSSGEPVFVVPRVRADNWNGLGSTTWAQDETRPYIDDIRGYDGEGSDMLRVVAAALKDRGVRNGLVGLEFRSAPVKLSSGLGKLLPGLRFEDCWPLINTMRMVKTAAEVETLTRLNRTTADTMDRILGSIRAGDTERDVASRLASSLIDHGAEEFSHTILGGGCRGGQWHPWPTNRVFEEGDLVRADWGIREHGYSSDIARTAVVGRASPSQRDTFSRLSEVHDVVVDAIAPGVIASDLVELARTTYQRLGLEFRWSIVGHGIGLVLHEEPHLTVDYDDPLVEGMTLEIELGWVDPVTGFHLEDFVHVGATSATNLITEPGTRTLIETA
nr:Xaa-Pro peptidase family protein [Rhodococcus sp. (in: high G+C Gram-positive bacteria)]